MISFPRTGSHWLRMLLEQYSDRPLLVRSFFEHRNQDYLLLHTHDMHLSEKRRSVIYLYRQPLDVVYSQMNFYQQDLRDLNLVIHWTNQYLSHLVHWLFLENHSVHKTIVCYENLKVDLVQEFCKVLQHLDLPLDLEKIRTLGRAIDKRKVAQNTQHDKRVVNQQADYEAQRIWFRQNYQATLEEWSRRIAHLTLGEEHRLLALFEVEKK
ncbi:MAG: sulfotransferase domain-containing protein [Bacteroidota bacterium]